MESVVEEESERDITSSSDQLEEVDQSDTGAASTSLGTLALPSPMREETIGQGSIAEDKYPGKKNIHLGILLVCIAATSVLLRLLRRARK
jgi:hypothetical protein